MGESAVIRPPNPELAALPNLFLLDPANRAFVEGRSRRIYDMGRIDLSSAWLVISVILGLFIHGIATTYPRVDFHGNDLIFIILFPFILMLVLTRIAQIYRRHLLVHKGVLVTGEIWRWEQHYKPDGEGGKTPEILMFYRFRVPPYGQTVEARRTCGLFGRPGPDTKWVAVLYVNDDLYEVL